MSGPDPAPHDVPGAPPAAAPDAARRDAEAAVAALQELLRRQADPRMSEVRVWVDRVVPERGMLYLGLALGEALGCSPFCGCAAKQMGEQMEPFLLERLPWLRRAVVEAQAPATSKPGALLLKLTPR